MAKTLKPAATPPAYEPDAEYQVRIAFPVRIGPFEYLPRDNLKAKGSLLNRIVEEHGANAIATADLC